MTTIRHGILRANGLYLVVAATGSLLMDVLGTFGSRGPESRILGSVPLAGVGFLEAHGIACR